MKISILPSGWKLANCILSHVDSGDIGSQLDICTTIIELEESTSIHALIDGILRKVLNNDNFQLRPILDNEHVITIQHDKGNYLLQIDPESVTFPDACDCVSWDNDSMTIVTTDPSWCSYLSNPSSFSVDGLTRRVKHYYLPPERILDCYVHAPWNKRMSITTTATTGRHSAYESLRLGDAAIGNRFSILAIDCLLHACSRLGTVYHDVSLRDFVVNMSGEACRCPSRLTTSHIHSRLLRSDDFSKDGIPQEWESGSMDCPDGVCAFRFEPRITCHREAIFDFPLSTRMSTSHQRIVHVLRMVSDFLHNMCEEATAAYGAERARDRFCAMTVLIDNWSTIESRMSEDSFNNVDGVREFGYVLYDVVVSNHVL